MVKFMVYKWLKHHAVEGKAVQFLSTGDVHGELKLLHSPALENSADPGLFHHLILKTGEV